MFADDSCQGVSCAFLLKARSELTQHVLVLADPLLLRSIGSSLHKSTCNPSSRRQCRFLPTLPFFPSSNKPIAFSSNRVEEQDISSPSQPTSTALPSHSRPLSKRQMAYLSPRLGVLNNIPFAIPFEVRVSIFRHFVENDRRTLGIDRCVTSLVFLRCELIFNYTMCLDMLGRVWSVGGGSLSVARMWLRTLLTI